MMETQNTNTTSVDPKEYDDPIRFAVEVARIAADNKTEDVQVLDLRGLSMVADVFVLGSGTSNRQMYAVADFIKQFAKGVNRRPFRVSGEREAKWILADYIDVVVHLFDSEAREYYDIDSLWGDAPRVAWQRESAEGDE